jgi:hypothetical protein
VTSQTIADGRVRIVVILCLATSCRCKSNFAFSVLAYEITNGAVIIIAAASS